MVTTVSALAKPGPKKNARRRISRARNGAEVGGRRLSAFSALRRLSTAMGADSGAGHQGLAALADISEEVMTIVANVCGRRRNSVWRRRRTLGVGVGAKSPTGTHECTGLSGRRRAGIRAREDLGLRQVPHFASRRCAFEG